MTAEENRVRTRRFIDAVIAGRNVAAIDEFVAADVVDHSAHPGQAPGIAGYKQSVQMLLDAFPDAQWQIEDLLAEGDRTATRFTMRGTHRGPLLDVPPTGGSVTFTGIVMSRHQDGQIVEEWMQWDMLGLLRQLAAVPTPQAAAS